MRDLLRGKAPQSWHSKTCNILQVQPLVHCLSNTEQINKSLKLLRSKTTNAKKKRTFTSVIHVLLGDTANTVGTKTKSQMYSNHSK